VVINIIVVFVTLLMLAFVAVAISSPRLRAWMEAPKYRFLEQERKFPEVVRNPAAPSENVDVHR
jgi:Flp pilus assembly protein TadB